MVADRHELANQLHAGYKGEIELLYGTGAGAGIGEHIYTRIFSAASQRAEQTWDDTRGK